jgi:hypothetical protein
MTITITEKFAITLTPLHTRIPFSDGKYNEITHNIFFANTIMNSYSDNIDAGFTSEKVFGRTDPIRFYEGNSRKISLSFYALEGENDTAGTLRSAVRKVMALQYPVYNPETKILVSPPIFKLEVGIQDFSDTARSAVGNPDKLLCSEIGVMSGFKYEEQELGKATGKFKVSRVRVDIGGGNFVERSQIDGSSKYYLLNFDFDVIHREIAGFDGNFPYEANSPLNVDTELGPKNLGFPFNISF